MRKSSTLISKFAERILSNCVLYWPNNEDGSFLRRFPDERRPVNMIEFNVQIPPDATIIFSKVKGIFSNGGPSRNVAISLHEKPLSCPIYEDDYAPLMSVKWVTGEVNNGDKFETPSLNSLIQFAFDRKKQVRNDHDDLAVVLTFAVQEPKLDSDERFTRDTRETKLVLIYEPNTVRK